MKRFLLAVACVMGFCFSGAASYADTSVTVMIPDYKCIINYSDVYYQDSQYPLISYKDITYFPMTYDYCKALELSSVWVDNEGLFIAYNQFFSYDDLPIYDTRANNKYNTAVIPGYPIYINGKRIDNSTQQYPLLNFRDVTYFPMTWDYAHEEFNWSTDWSDGTFTLHSLASFEDNSSVSMDVYDVGEEGAEIVKYYSYSNPTGHTDEYGNEEYTPVTQYKFYRMDYADGDLTEISFSKDGYTDFNQWYSQKRGYNASDADVEASIVNGHVFCEGNDLHEIAALQSSESTLDNMDIHADHRLIDSGTYDKDVYNFTIHTNLEVPAPYTPAETYGYVKVNGNFVLVAQDGEITNMVRGDDGTLYVNFRVRSGYHSNLKPICDLYRVGTDGSVRLINDEYPDYGSMRLLGKANGKLYLKCEWGANFSIMSAGYDISPYNDGYFTYDGSRLERVARYTYTDSDFLTPSGDIYGVIQWKDEIRKLS